MVIAMHHLEEKGFTSQKKKEKRKRKLSIKCLFPSKYRYGSQGPHDVFYTSPLCQSCFVDEVFKAGLKIVQDV